MSVNSTLGPRKSSQSRSPGHTLVAIGKQSAPNLCIWWNHVDHVWSCAILLCCYATSWRDPMDYSVQARFMLQYFTLASNLPRDLLMHHLGIGWHGGCRWQWSRGCFGSIRCIETETRRTPGHGSWTIQCKTNKGHPDLSARGSIISILHKYTSIIGFS